MVPVLLNLVLHLYLFIWPLMLRAADRMLSITDKLRDHAGAVLDREPTAVN